MLLAELTLKKDSTFIETIELNPIARRYWYIGRASFCQLVIPSEKNKISRINCTIAYIPDLQAIYRSAKEKKGFMLLDGNLLKTYSSGVFVDGKRIKSLILNTDADVSLQEGFTLSFRLKKEIDDNSDDTLF